MPGSAVFKVHVHAVTKLCDTSLGEHGTESVSGDIYPDPRTRVVEHRSAAATFSGTKTLPAESDVPAATVPEHSVFQPRWRRVP